MTFYGSEFIIVLFYGLQQGNVLQGFAAFDSSVLVYLGRASALYFFSSSSLFCPPFNLFFFQKYIVSLHVLAQSFSYSGGCQSSLTQGSMGGSETPSSFRWFLVFLWWFLYVMLINRTDRFTQRHLTLHQHRWFFSPLHESAELGGPEPGLWKLARQRLHHCFTIWWVISQASFLTFLSVG